MEVGGLARASGDMLGTAVQVLLQGGCAVVWYSQSTECCNR
jgi:hypothetical protein